MLPSFEHLQSIYKSGGNPAFIKMDTDLYDNPSMRILLHIAANEPWVKDSHIKKSNNVLESIMKGFEDLGYNVGMNRSPETNQKEIDRAYDTINDLPDDHPVKTFTNRMWGERGGKKGLSNGYSHSVDDDDVRERFRDTTSRLNRLGKDPYREEDMNGLNYMLTANAVYNLPADMQDLMANYGYSPLYLNPKYDGAIGWYDGDEHRIHADPTYLYYSPDTVPHEMTHFLDFPNLAFDNDRNFFDDFVYEDKSYADKLMAYSKVGSSLRQKYRDYKNEYVDQPLLDAADKVADRLKLTPGNGAQMSDVLEHIPKYGAIGDLFKGIIARRVAQDQEPEFIENVNAVLDHDVSGHESEYWLNPIHAPTELHAEITSALTNPRNRPIFLNALRPMRRAYNDVNRALLDVYRSMPYLDPYLTGKNTQYITPYIRLLPDYNTRHS